MLLGHAPLLTEPAAGLMSYETCALTVALQPADDLVRGIGGIKATSLGHPVEVPVGKPWAG